MDGHKSRVFSICSHPTDNNVFVSGGWDDTVQFWDVRQNRAARLDEFKSQLPELRCEVNIQAEIVM